MTEDTAPTFRAFLGLPIPESAAAVLAGHLTAFRRAFAPRLRWIPRAHWHLTVRFLGATPMAAAADLGALIDASATAAAGPVTAELEQLGPFPRRRPATLAFTLAASPALARLADALRSRVEALGFAADDRPFRPHVTVGRPDRGAALPSMPVAATVSFERVALYRSETLPTGAHYTEVHGRQLVANA